MKRTSRTQQVLYLVFGGGMALAANVAVVIVLARLLSSADYGTYRQVLLVSTLIVPIFSAAIPNSLLYFLPRLPSDEHRAALVRRTVFLLGGLGIGTSIVMAATSVLVARQFNNPPLRNYLLIGCLYPAFVLASKYLVPCMISLGKARLSALYSSVSSLISFVVVAATALATGSVKAVIVAMVATSGIGFALALFLSNRFVNIFRSGLPRPTPLKEQLAYVAPLGLASLVTIWSHKIDQTVITSFFDVETYAIYTVGATEFPLGALLSTSIYSVLLPEITRLMSEGKKADVLALWQRTVEKAALLILPVFGAVLLASHTLITLLYSQRYVASVVIFQIYAFLMPIRVVNYGLMLKALGKTKYDFYGSVLYLAVNVGISVVLVRLVGIAGPALSLVLSTYLLAMFLLVHVTRETGFGFGEVLTVKRVAPVLVVTGAPLVVNYVISGNVSYRSLPEAVASLAVYAGIVGLFYGLTGRFAKLGLKRAPIAPAVESAN